MNLFKKMFGFSGDLKSEALKFEAEGEFFEVIINKRDIK